MIARRWILTAVLVAAACTDEVEVGANNPLIGSGGSAGSDAAPECVPAIRQGHSYQCGDCIDNDQDGLIDAADPECLGPWDDTEETFYGGDMPNSTPCRQDCYFDSDSGSGNDECYWSHRCDPRSRAPDYPPSADARCDYDPSAMIPGISASCADLAASQPERCQQACQPLTPNGCDCFGCCELPYGSGQHVWLGSAENGVGTCDLAHVGDPLKCRPCTPVEGCFNPCEPCEVCVGRSPGEPGPCVDGGQQVPQPCGAGGTPCGREGQAQCGPNQYCITGCCVTIPS